MKKQIKEKKKILVFKVYEPRYSVFSDQRKQTRND